VLTTVPVLEATVLVVVPADDDDWVATVVAADDDGVVVVVVVPVDEPIGQKVMPSRVAVRQT
jgi:hypothetical protein